MGALIAELRAANIASQRVRGGEPAPGDAKAAGSYQRFVVLSRLGVSREHRAPMQEVRIGVRAYGVTFQDAAALYGQISDVVDNAGPRLSGSGVAIYQSLDDTGGTAEKDPDTGQPYESGVIALYAGTALVA
jgi:hypothetical protein